MIPSQHVVAEQRPLAEVVVEGELSPFEDETLYRILRKRFRLEHPSYIPLNDDKLASRVNVSFRYPYEIQFFTQILQENWRDLKELLKQVAHRRGKAGAAFTIKFGLSGKEVVFLTGTLSEAELGSALDQIGHLTAIVGQVQRAETMEQPIVKVETSYDRASDRWHNFKGVSSSGDKYVFDDPTLRWVVHKVESP